MSLKRSASPMHFLSRPSPHNSAVTLFESAGRSTFTEADYSQSPRRSKRAKYSTSVKVKSEDFHPSADEPVLQTSTRKFTRALKSESRRPKSMKLESPSPRKKKLIQMSLEVPHPTPPLWEEQYNAIKEMRKKYVAPVDTMGCDTAQLKELDPKVCSSKPYSHSVS